METTPAAVYGGKTGQVVEALVASCADIEALNRNGLTPLELAHNGLANGTSEWQKLRCRETVEVLEIAKDMTTGLRRWLMAAGLAEQWKEFARLGAKEKEDVEMIERDDVRRDKGSSLTPIQVNRLFRAVGQCVERPGERFRAWGTSSSRSSARTGWTITARTFASSAWRSSGTSWTSPTRS